MVNNETRPDLAVSKFERHAVPVALLPIDADRCVAARVERTDVEVAAMLVDGDPPLESFSHLFGVSHADKIGIVHWVLEP